ncbi:uncharacterized protein PG986_012093 [Apiospora aurea]|uniref:Pentatricopeptide repeat domain-containing protein n=1 Tax=Apiospora aurea TaxID=335848 RepID=A0ABR1PZ97_9PEZI
MSLGVKSVWRAPVCTLRAQGLSLIPREAHPRLAKLLHNGSTRLYSSNTSNDSLVRHVHATRPANAAAAPSTPDQTADASAPERTIVGPSPSAYRRAKLRRVIKRMAIFREKTGSPPSNQALVSPAVRYPSKHETERSAKKHRVSADRQELFDFLAGGQGAAGDEVAEHPESADQVVVGKAVVQNVLEMLTGSTAAVATSTVTQRRSGCIIRTEHIDHRTETVTLSLSGAEHPVRKALTDILKGIGSLTAVRVMDPDSKEILMDLWAQKNTEPPSIRLLGEADVALDANSLTVQKGTASEGRVLPVSRYYTLSHHVKDIKRPAQWTARSLEAYISALVHGVVPRHLVGAIYGEGQHAPKHKETVASILVELFQSEETQSLISTNSLHLALAFLQKGGLSLRPQARTIFDQAEVRKVPMDTQTFNLFLQGCAMAGDLDGFSSTVKLMLRKGYHPDSKTWLELLHLVQDVQAKQTIVGKMERKGLARIQSTLVQVGSHMAPFKLQSCFRQLSNVGQFVLDQDQLHGPEWLTTTTFNRLLEVLGRNSRLDLCNNLLDYAAASGRVRPDAVSLNTMITHGRNVHAHVATIRSMRERWTTVHPDEATFNLLFQIAWKNRGPNQLRVILRYASFAKQTSTHMRSKLDLLLSGDRDLSGRRVLLKAWEDVIFGQDEIRILRRRHGKQLGSYRIARRYTAQTLVYEPAADLASKLLEAYEMDRKIHAALKAGEVMTPSARNSFVVDIPMRPRVYQGKILRLPAPSSSSSSSSGNE